jgi:ATP-dependent Clp protease ATP-binding subunit ClpC
MFERLTEKSMKALELARQEARAEGHAFVGSEQILIGLIVEGTGIAARVLQSKQVDLEAVRREARKIIGIGAGSPAEIAFTPKAKRALELSWDEALLLRHNYIGTEHLLLGLLRDGDNVAVKVLQNFGVDIREVRALVIELIVEIFEKSAAADLNNWDYHKASIDACKQYLQDIERPNPG